MNVGDIFSWERTFTEEDIRLFTLVSQDRGVHHTTPDAQGRLMAQGLLTATLPTKFGGDINFLAQQLSFEFLRAVYAGDSIRCQVTIAELEKLEKYTRLACTWTCRNQNDEEVLTGRASGVIRN